MGGGLQVGSFEIPEEEIHETFTTWGGPGGQHANRSRTAVELRFEVAATRAFPPEVRDRIVSRLGPVEGHVLRVPVAGQNRAGTAAPRRPPGGSDAEGGAPPPHAPVGCGPTSPTRGEATSGGEEAPAPSP